MRERLRLIGAAAAALMIFAWRMLSFNYQLSSHRGAAIDKEFCAITKDVDRAWICEPAICALGHQAARRRRQELQAPREIRASPSRPSSRTASRQTRLTIDGWISRPGVRASLGLRRLRRRRRDRRILRGESVFL